jgi:16S rRNA (cytidine1402-2'-O)-methyltransferase
LIACEDTRNSSVLLNHYNIKKPLVSFHSHSKVAKVDKIISDLKSGKNIALISDA